MMWVWIIAAIAISWLLCRKKVAWYHYIWMLLPVEMYGITIAGATIKPYMILGVFMIIKNLLDRKAHKVPAAFVAIIFLLSVSDILNGLIIASIMQHVMFLVIIYIAYNYVLISENDDDLLENIEVSTIATTIGYGLVFLVAYWFYSRGIGFGGIYTTDRYSAGMLLNFISTGGQTTVRLRGFCIDPNSVVTTLIPGASFGLARLLYKNGGKFRSLVAVILYAIVMDLSGSRMAVVCTVAMVIIMLMMGYKQAENKLWWFGLIALVLLVVSFMAVYRFQNIASEVYSFFTARAGLNDTGGRFTIWKYNARWLSDNGRLLFGVGQNQISNLTSVGKACHNTWLEWICGTGILLGGMIDLWFVITPFVFLDRLKRNRIFIRDIIPIVLAYVTALICITTVDNITNSVVLFLMVIFRYGNYINLTLNRDQGL